MCYSDVSTLNLSYYLLVCRFREQTAHSQFTDWNGSWFANLHHTFALLNYFMRGFYCRAACLDCDSFAASYLCSPQRQHCYNILRPFAALQQKFQVVIQSWSARTFLPCMGFVAIEQWICQFVARVIYWALNCVIKLVYSYFCFAVELVA